VIVRGIYYRRLWPLMGGLARLYRRTGVRRTRLVVVVGTFGKTTTTLAVQEALGLPPKQRINSNGQSFVAEGVLRIRPGQRHAALEVAISSVGRMAMYADLLRPNVAVVTSIGSEHNRSLGTLEVTRHEKAEMVRALPADGLAVLNGDDPNVRWMAGQTRARVLTFGFGADNDVRASDFRIDWPHGSRFPVQVGGEAREVRTRLLGRHQAYSILAAVTVASAEGFDLDETVTRLEALRPTPGRMQLVPLDSGAFVLRDEFKSAMETIDTALETLAEIPARRRIAMIGGITEPLGSQGPLYQRIGARLGQIAGRIVFYGTDRNYRSVRAGVLKAGQTKECLTFVGTDILQAVEAVRSELQPGDVVLVKGRHQERLDRVSLALSGRTIRCTLTRCTLRSVSCDTCPMLERGWGSRE
jgi:UDP-N-acetylmuramyl pentapeptide synthase